LLQPLRAGEKGAGAVLGKVTAQIAEVVVDQARQCRELEIVESTRAALPAPGRQLQVACAVTGAGEGEAVVDQVDARALLVPEHVAGVAVLLADEAVEEGPACGLLGDGMHVVALADLARAEQRQRSDFATTSGEFDAAVTAERLRPTKLIAESLGPRPKEPLKAALWNEGVDLIYGYRQRNGITATGGHPLGPRPREAARRRERQQAERRLARIQKRLGMQRVKSAERALRLFR
jgi:hypothetical protein